MWLKLKADPHGDIVVHVRIAQSEKVTLQIGDWARSCWCHWKT